MKRQLTRPTQWHVYDEQGVFCGVINYHLSPDVKNRYLAAVARAAEEVGASEAAYSTLWSATRAVISQAHQRRRLRVL